MIKKYRVKLTSGRIVGPFLPDQVGELFTKGHVSGSEDYQKFPGGAWVKIEELPDLSHVIEQLISKKIHGTNETTSPKEEGPKKEQTESKEKATEKDGPHPDDNNYSGETPADFAEFKYSKESTPEITPTKEKVQSEENIGPPPSEETEIDQEILDKTRVARTMPSIPEDADKTIIRSANIDIPKQLEEGAESDNEQDLEGEDEEEVDEEKLKKEEQEEKQNEKTEMLNISSLLPDLKQVVAESEDEFKIAKKKELEEHDKMLKESLKEEDEEEDEDEDEDEDEEEDEEVKKKKMKPIVLIAFLVIIGYLALEDEGGEELIAPRSLVISFPLSGEFIEEDKSKLEFQKGMNSYTKGTYGSRVIAAGHFKKSLFYKFKDPDTNEYNPALGQIILTYAELLPNTANMRSSGNTLYRLIKIARGKQLKDINFSIGSALFYFHFKKYHTARAVIENYLRVSKPSIKLLAYYLAILLEVGDLTKAKQIYTKLSPVPNKPLELYIYLARYLELIQEQDRASELLVEARKTYGRSVLLLLEELKYTLRDQDYKKFGRILKAIEGFNAENSPVYYAKWVENMGVLKALQDKPEDASRYFRLALKIRESDELRSKLAALEMGGSKRTDSLILESKIIDLMVKSKKAVREKKWQQAFSYAIEASDLSETYIPSRLLLARIQIRRGFFDSAISTLLKLRDEHPLNRNVNYSLVMAYIESYKLAEAQREINNLSKTKFATTSEYSSLLGRYYRKTGNRFLTLRWLHEAISKNPLADEDYFLIAEILLEVRKYGDSKRSLSNAISLDPTNVDYRSLYGRILYELKGADVAIGYLRDLLISHKEHPKLLGDIARYYYQSGQMKEFEQYKEKIEASDTRDTSFYAFLIEASKNDDQDESVIKYSEELIKLNPGDLGTRIMLGTFYHEMKKYKESLNQFEKVKNRLPEYPKVNYYLAKVKLAMNDIDTAIELAEKEIKSNPTLEHGYYIMGASYKAKKDWTNAIAFLEKAISRNPKSVETMSDLAWIKSKQNYFAASRELYLRAIKQDNANADLHKDLAYVYKSMGQSGLAIESFNVYLRLSPGAKDEGQIKSLIKSLDN